MLRNLQILQDFAPDTRKYLDTSAQPRTGVQHTYIYKYIYTNIYIPLSIDMDKGNMTYMEIQSSSAGTSK